MGFYADRVVPRLIDWSMRNARLKPFRERVVGAAEGRVLEIGIGSGVNLPYYRGQVRQIIGLDPSLALLARAADRASGASVPVELIQRSAEEIPLDDGSVDTVLMTWTGCSIPDIETALGEMRRVLRPGGRLLFVEHGRAAEPAVARWQDRLTPVWKRIAGGCHLNRPVSGLIEEAGFRFDRLETGHNMPGFRPLTYIYEGSARPARLRAPVVSHRRSR